MIGQSRTSYIEGNLLNFNLHVCSIRRQQTKSVCVTRENQLHVNLIQKHSTLIEEIIVQFANHLRASTLVYETFTKSETCIIISQCIVMSVRVLVE